MSAVLGILMVAIAGLYVAAPFFRRDADEEAPQPQPIAAEDLLERQKREAYAAIKEAEFDHQMGKLSDADFAALTEKYRLQALAAIAALESGAAPVKNERTHPAARLAFCPGCGSKLPASANFCPACGRGIKADRETLQARSGQALSGAVAQTG